MVPAVEPVGRDRDAGPDSRVSGKPVQEQSPAQPDWEGVSCRASAVGVSEEWG